MKCRCGCLRAIVSRQISVGGHRDDSVLRAIVDDLAHRTSHIFGINHQGCSVLSIDDMVFEFMVHVNHQNHIASLSFSVTSLLEYRPVFSAEPS